MGDSLKEIATPFTAVNQMVLMLKRESKFFTGIRRSDIQSLTDVLEQLNRFLKEADATAVEEVMRKSVESWLEQTKDAEGVKGYAEESCVLKLSQILQDHRLNDFLSKATERFSMLSTSYDLASDVQNRTALPHDNKARGRMYNITEQEVTSRTSVVEWYSQNQVFSLIEEYVDRAANNLMAWLKEDASTCSVISLVGPGGIGKTFLAKKVYQSQIIRDHFDCCAWIPVPRPYEKKELLKVMIKQIAQDKEHDVARLDRMRMMELIGTLRKSLESKRYMFVFDDVCHEEFWRPIKYCLPNNGKGSRILVTTRSDAVVASCTEGSFDHVQRLEPLSEAMSWDLFCRIAFKDEPEWHCPPELEKMSREFIRIVNNFPLPIIAIAGLLSMKDKTVLEWQKQHDHLSLEVKCNLYPRGALEVLALSFWDLPNHLVSCFLCFSIFPKDSLISNDKLYKLWIAEGFVEEKAGKTLEEVAEEYLNELINRNLVQACEGFYGLEQFCRVHRLIHDMTRAKADELNFCCIWDHNNIGFGRQNSRVSICNNVNNVLETMEGSQVHSVFLFNIGTLNDSFLVGLLGNFKSLTLLDFEYAPIEQLPGELGNLYHLKYLNLKNTKLRQLPIFVNKLLNLQTLDLRNTPLIDLPIVINNLNKLQHLLASVYDDIVSGNSARGVRIKEGLGGLQNLRSLMIVEAYHSGIDLMQDLANLRQLRRLGISKLTAEVAFALCTCINELSHLESLSLQSMNKHEILDLHSISSPPPLLQDLILKCPLGKIPDWIFCLQNLSMLCLSFSRLIDDPLKHLSHLPNLLSLWLFQAYEGEKLHFEEGSFKRLKLLVLSELNELKVMRIDRGALSLLEELRIGPTPLLNQVPSGIYYLRNLKVLAQYDTPRELMLSMQPDGGSEYWKVEHIPSVVFRYKLQGASYISFNLGDSNLLNYLQNIVTRPNVVTLHQYEHQLSFCYSDDEGDDDVGPLNSCHSNDEEDDDVGPLSFFNNSFNVQQRGTVQSSFSSGFYTDDLEE